VTISKGAAWGSEVARPDHLRVAADDAHLALLTTDGTGHPTAVGSGDLFRTVGARPLGDRSKLFAFPVDLVTYRIDDGPIATFAAHLVARRPLIRGGAWRGPVLAVMNAEWIGPFDVAPRGHPNDGRVETFLASASLTVRQRLAVRSRLRNATHLPHPLITTRSVRAGEWEFDHPMDFVADGETAGRGRQLTIEVQSDATVLFA
jgi:hypothetical protein